MPLSSKVLAKIVNGSAIPLFVINSEHQITHWNAAIEALSGKKSRDVMGRDNHWAPFYNTKRPTMADLIVDRASYQVLNQYYHNKFRKSALISGAYEAEDFFPALGNTGTWIHFTASPIRDDSGEIIGAIETLLDITERKNLEENLRFYSQQITHAHEEERLYLARELHDEMAQIIGSASRQLDNLLRKNPKVGTDELSALKDIQNLLADGSRAMNIMIRNLRPPLLDDLGLIPALRSLSANLEETEGVITGFTVIGEEIRLGSEKELLLFRIVQEALSNVRKHAEATEVSVVVGFHEDQIVVSVNDNGRGFQLPASMDSLPRSGKLGLMGMQERIWLLGGSIEVDSKPGQGTSLKFLIPPHLTI